MRRGIARATAVAGMVAGTALAGGSPASAQTTDRDCPDFSSQQEAQDYYESKGGPAQDPDRLDRDNDGEACEEYDGYSNSGNGGGGGGSTPEPTGESPQTSETPSGGVEAGAGGMAMATNGCETMDTSFEDVTAVRGNSFTIKQGTFRFDPNDGFAIGAEGEPLTFAQFQRALSVGDGVQVFEYCRDRAGESGFALIEFVDSTPAPQITATPDGGVATGAGGTAGEGLPVLPIGATALGLALLGGGVIAARRRQNH